VVGVSVSGNRPSASALHEKNDIGDLICKNKKKSNKTSKSLFLKTIFVVKYCANAVLEIINILGIGVGTVLQNYYY